jgi:hypothetical protein
MADGPIVVVEGAHELAQKMRTAAVGLQAEMRYAHEQAAEIVVDEALPNVPVGPSGNLRRNLHARATVASGRAVSNLPYSMAVHWGRRVGNVGRPSGNHTGPNAIVGNPFIWNAAKAKEEEITAVHAVVVQTLLDRVID